MAINLALGLTILLILLAGCTRENKDSIVDNQGSLERNIAKVYKEAKPIVRQLNEALIAEDKALIYEAVEALKLSFGEWAGKPEEEPRYYQSSYPDKQWANEDISLYLASLLKRIEEDAYLGNGIYSKPGEPTGPPPMVRSTGYMVSGLSKLISIYEVNEESAIANDKSMFWTNNHQMSEYESRLIESADYLLEVQRDNGLFPFPNILGHGTQFERALKALKEKKPEAFEDDWVIEDDGSGGSQFNTSVNGIALIDAYLITGGDERYLEGAKKSG